MDTFYPIDEAESALCRDRPNFLTRHDIVQLIPPAITKRVNHPGDIAQIEGFQELFVHLNTDPSAEKLRKLVVNYFNGSPILRPYLSQSHRLIYRTTRYTYHSVMSGIISAGHPGEETLPFRSGHVADASTSLSPQLGSSAENLVR